MPQGIRHESTGATNGRWRAGLAEVAGILDSFPRVALAYREEGERIPVFTGVFTQPTELNALFDALERGLGG